MATTSSTTISGVSFLKDEQRGTTDVFTLTLSVDGCDIRRRDRPMSHLAWARVTGWEVEARESGVLLTLRGTKASTALLVPGWTVDELEARLRALTENSRARGPEEALPLLGVATSLAPQARRDEAAAEPPAAEPSAPEPAAATAATATAQPEEPTVDDTDAAASTTGPEAARGNAPGPHRPAKLSALIGAHGKVIVTVALLGVLAAAVTIVLLQSAGVISWSFLGPTS